MNSVLLNTTTLNKGGALQAAVNFIKMAERDASGIHWSYAISREVALQLERLAIRPSRTFVTQVSPARSRSTRRDLLAYEKSVMPDLVFTFFGPAYIRFRSFHVCGVANPWVTHPNLYAYRTLPMKQLAAAMFGRIYRAWWIARADAWIVEAEVAKRGLTRLLRLPSQRIHVVPNVCADQYRSIGARRPVAPKANDVAIFCFSAYYPHKHLELIPLVAQALQLRQPHLRFRFVMSLPEASADYRRIRRSAERLGVADRIRTIGAIDIADGPNAYAACDISFLPTLLETNTAVFAESMAIGLPIVTTNFEFNTVVCGDAALYFEPANADSAAETLLRLIGDPDLWRVCVSRGREKVALMMNQSGKYQACLECLTQYVRTSQARFHR